MNAMVSIQPDVTASVERALRSIDTPTLCVVGGSAQSAERLLSSLSLNSRLGSDYFVLSHKGCSEKFVLGPTSQHEREAVAHSEDYTTAWFDRYVPETDQRTRLAGRI